MSKYQLIGQETIYQTWIEEFDYNRINEFTSGTAETIWVLPAFVCIRNVALLKTEEFANEATALTLDLGRTGDGDNFIAAQDIGDGGMTVNSPLAIDGGAVSSYQASDRWYIYRGTSDTNILAEFTDANVGSLTAGKLLVIWDIVDFRGLYSNR